MHSVGRGAADSIARDSGDASPAGGPGAAPPGATAPRATGPSSNSPLSVQGAEDGEAATSDGSSSSAASLSVVAGSRLESFKHSLDRWRDNADGSITLGEDTEARPGGFGDFFRNLTTGKFYSGFVQAFIGLPAALVSSIVYAKVTIERGRWDEVKKFLNPVEWYRAWRKSYRKCAEGDGERSGAACGLVALDMVPIAAGFAGRVAFMSAKRGLVRGVLRVVPRTLDRMLGIEPWIPEHWGTVGGWRTRVHDAAAAREFRQLLPAGLRGSAARSSARGTASAGSASTSSVLSIAEQTALELKTRGPRTAASASLETP
jgi:hypothetical protein